MHIISIWRNIFLKMRIGKSMHLFKDATAGRVKYANVKIRRGTSTTSSRTWKVKVSQIECTNPNLWVLVYFQHSIRSYNISWLVIIWSTVCRIVPTTYCTNFQKWKHYSYESQDYVVGCIGPFIKLPHRLLQVICYCCHFNLCTLLKCLVIWYF